MNLTTTLTAGTSTTTNPLPPSPPLAVLPVSSLSSVRIVIPSNHLPTPTLQSPSLVTPPTAAPSITLFASSPSMVSNPLAPPVRTDSFAASSSLSNVVTETSSSSSTTTTTANNTIATATNIPVETTTTTAITMNEEITNNMDDDEDDDDAFMMDIEIPNMLDDDEEEDDMGAQDDETPLSIPILPVDHSNPSSLLTATTPTVSTGNSSASQGATAVGMAVGTNGGGCVIDKEKIGRWTEQEHLVFLEGLRTHGKQWKVIATMIGTRTVVQVRTHAQKYFQKLDRNSGGNGTNGSSNPIMAVTSTSVASASTAVAIPVTATASTNAATVSIPGTQPQQPVQAAATMTLLSPKSTILPPQQQQQQRATYTKRKSLPSSLPSRSKSNHHPNPKKSRTNKMNPRLSMGNRGTCSTTATTAPPANIELPSYPSYISKSSSSTGSDENWSTISPDNVIWDRVDFGNSNSSEYALISEDSYNDSALYSSNTVDVDSPPTNPSSNAFDLLGEDPLEWLIETDCTQQYLPESSLPLFPFQSINSDHNTMDDDYDDKLHIHNNPIVDGIVDDMGTSAATMSTTAPNDDNEVLLLRMTDPNVTVQSLFLPTTTTAKSTVLEQ